VVFRNRLLFLHFSVRDNLLYGAPRLNPALYDWVVKVLSLAPRQRRRPGRLSGGGRQCVALGRALHSEPRLLVLNEPLSARDPEMKVGGLVLLEAMQDATATPMLCISHARRSAAWPTAA
jgi:ABC-type molybdate transport system ATPase subunit